MENITWETPNAYLRRRVRELNERVSRITEEKDAALRKCAAMESSFNEMAQGFSELKAQLADEMFPPAPMPELSEPDGKIIVSEPPYNSFDYDVVASMRIGAHRTTVLRRLVKRCLATRRINRNTFHDESSPPDYSDHTRRPPPDVIAGLGLFRN